MTINCDQMQRRAVFSPCRRWRYSLRRVLDPFGPKATWIMLNPSTADAMNDDQTTTVCMGRMFRAGWTVYEAVNLFALVGTDPACLRSARDPVGRDNDEAILLAVEDANPVVVAWGRDGTLQGRDRHVLRLLGNRELWCIGQNQDGSPRFPRAVPRDFKLEIFRPAA